METFGGYCKVPSVVKQKGMVFGFRKTATAVTRPERQIDCKIPNLVVRKHIKFIKTTLMKKHDILLEWGIFPID
jgi:hypothetical protein